MNGVSKMVTEKEGFGKEKRVTGKQAHNPLGGTAGF
jgi:hypothetical protein